jgi:hypothetical protein
MVDTVRRQLRLRASEIEEALETNDAVTAALHPAKDAWVKCELCQKWRNVSKATFIKHVDSSFRCALDIDRPEIYSVAAKLRTIASDTSALYKPTGE